MKNCIKKSQFTHKNINFKGVRDIALLWARQKNSNDKKITFFER